MLHWFHRRLLALPPEWAHGIAIFFLRLYQWLYFRCLGKRLSGEKTSAPAVRISTFPKLHFPNRLGVAAGLDKDAQVFAALGALGFGFVEVGTVTPVPQAGNPKPRLWRFENESLVNQMGFNNGGGDLFRQRILHYRSCVPSLPLFANLGKGVKTPLAEAWRDYQLLAQQLMNCVDGFVVNVSSPNTAGLRELQSTEFLEKIASVLPKEKPVLIKLAPDLSNQEIQNLSEHVQRTPAFQGMVLTNTSRALAQQLGQKDKGGLSGQPLFERALECVACAREKLSPDKVVIGVGGISSASRAKAMREAGADLIEVYTPFIYQGPKLISELVEALR